LRANVQARAYPLLCACAGSAFNPLASWRLAQAASSLEDWQEVPALAERHGLAPLLYVQLRDSGLAIPPDVRETLQALYLRHRRANQARFQVLSQVLATFDTAGIRALVLKGAALSHLIYPEPGLRPMRDLDILVDRQKASRAQDALAGLGFQVPQLDPWHRPARHLAAAALDRDGLHISVEIHRQLTSDYMGAAAPDFAQLYAERQPFPLGDRLAFTLGHNDMLWHLCSHAVDILEPLRLIWVADIAGFVECFAGEMAWERLRHSHPSVFGVLALLHFLTPLSDEVRQRSGLAIGAAPGDVGVEFEGWPRRSLAECRARGMRRAWADTFVPGEWWLRLYYGLGARRSIFWTRWVRHPLHILSWPWRVLPGMLGRQVPVWYRRLFWRPWP
jgi:hypothetical protein